MFLHLLIRGPFKASISEHQACWNLPSFIRMWRLFWCVAFQLKERKQLINESNDRTRRKHKRSPCNILMFYWREEHCHPGRPPRISCTPVCRRSAPAPNFWMIHELAKQQALLLVEALFGDARFRQPSFCCCQIMCSVAHAHQRIKAKERDIF